MSWHEKEKGSSSSFLSEKSLVPSTAFIWKVLYFFQCKYFKSRISLKKKKKKVSAESERSTHRIFSFSIEGQIVGH